MHRKLRVGSVLQMNVSNMNLALGGKTEPGLPPEFVRFSGTVYRLGCPVSGAGSQPDYEPIQQGESSNSNRSFVWLPYQPGFITLVPFQRSMSICTGWMSGCWLVLCTMKGAAYFAHIGTANNPHDAATVKVKNAFKIGVGTGVISIVKAFQPMCRTSEDTMGALSKTGNFYTIGISKVTQALPRAQPTKRSGGPVIEISAPVGGSFTNLQVIAKTREPGQPALPFNF